MATQLGDELIWWCPTLDDDSNATLAIDDLVGTNDGTLTSMETADWVADTSSSGIRCLATDGVAEYVNLATLTTMDSIAAETISFWFYRSSASHHGSFGKENGTTRNYIDVDGNGTLYGFLGTSIYGSVANVLTGWHHFAMVFDGAETGNANRLKLYVDGTLQSLSFTGTVGTTTPSMAAVVFRAGIHGGQYSTGRFDDMRVFDVALSQANITKLASIRGYQPDSTGTSDGTEYFTEPTGLTLFAFPRDDSNISLSQWSAYRRVATEDASPDLGLYTATLDGVYSTWYIFSGTARPGSWDEAIDVITLDSGTNYNLTVLPAQVTLNKRFTGSLMELFVGETITLVKTFYNTDRTPLNFFGKNIEIHFSTATGVNIATIETADILVSGVDHNILTWDTPEEVTEEITDCETGIIWSVRDATNGDAVLVYGPVVVAMAAMA